VIERIGVIGAGAWGTTLAGLLAEKVGKVHLWVYEEELCGIMARERENAFYLPGYRLPPGVTPDSSLVEVAKGKDLIVSVVPSQFVRAQIREIVPHLEEKTIVLSASKGIEDETLMLMSEVFREILPPNSHDRMAILSGPSFAREVARKLPTAVTVAAEDPDLASTLQHLLSTAFFRVYTGKDITGVQLGGALKNVMAIAVGASDGIGLGHNTRAALITRGLAEITRLGRAMGADPLTFLGLSGMGDLVLTCTSDLSRNRMVGQKLGRGMTLQQILRDMKAVAEGVTTCSAAYELSRKHDVDMPIIESVYSILYGNRDIHSAVEKLMKRRLTEEMY
jgi:glycerol-3-phosphate dehydrogenase (NAD(P)+)